jgi:hypothetical protein
MPPQGERTHCSSYSYSLKKLALKASLGRQAGLGSTTANGCVLLRGESNCVPPLEQCETGAKLGCALPAAPPPCCNPPSGEQQSNTAALANPPAPLPCLSTAWALGSTCKHANMLHSQHTSSTFLSIGLWRKVCGQLITIERGVCGGPITFHCINLVSHNSSLESLACVESLHQDVSAVAAVGPTALLPDDN